jgi:8-oxo-dGTP pyrophosphatase MutT (NUDIX family)
MSELQPDRSKAAVLVLIRKSSEGSSVLLIERSATVKTHQSQVAFPGGGMEKQDQQNPVLTALRECEEEVGIVPDRVSPWKVLPPIPTLTSGFFVIPVLARWEGTEAPELKLDLEEVAHAEWVSVQELKKSRRIEKGFPVFDWPGKDNRVRKVWGLTAIIFDLVFHSDAESL